MENGDRQKVLQHRLLGIYPDYLQRIVAWSGGAHLPPAVHVSNGTTETHEPGWPRWETTSGLVHSGGTLCHPASFAAVM